MEEKVSPYLRPLYDALHDMMDFEKADQLVARGLIEVAPIAFMRGRTLNDAVVILDEAQNTTSEQMKMFLTRLGFESKAVITGDVTQIDLPDNRRSGLTEAINLLSGIPGISFRYFTEVDVVRHPLVQQIIKAYDAAKPGPARGCNLSGVTQGAEAQSNERARYELAELVETARALASQRDIKKLLSLILLKCRQVTGADAGSVYVIEEEGGSQAEYKPAPKKFLHFMLSQNDSVKVDFEDFKLDIDDSSIVGQAVLAKHPINIPDLTRLASTPKTSTLRHNRSFDDQTGYRARSMLTVPMLSAEREVIGVVQLINKRKDSSRPLQGDADGDVVAFDHRSEELALAWVAMAGIALENALLYD